jgi:2',3'-cyclic-nucleotide 2'-phosphodiesterase (5'-nucleotidase family)
MVSATLSTASADPINLTLLHTNDLYQISPVRGEGGIAELMTLLRAERAANANTITTFGGDVLSPSVLSGLTEGAQMIELFNAIGMDVAVFGNHEFDFGNEVLSQRVAESDFVWLGTNVVDDSGAPAFGSTATWTRTIGDFTIGFFGLLTPETDTLSSVEPGVSFEPIIASANQAVEALQEQGADVIVALTHQEIDEDRALAAQVDDIDIILGGHDHDPITFYERDVLIHKSGTDGQFLGIVELTINEVEGRRGPEIVVQPAWRMVAVRNVDPDPAIVPIIARFNELLEAELGVEIGTTNVELVSVRARVRSEETTMGNVITDAMRAEVGADIAITNGGGIRGDTIYDAGTVLTRADILTELPFGNTTVLVEISGADVLAALENGVSAIEDGAGRFAQVSGLSFVYDPAAPAGERIVSVTVGGNPLDTARSYKVAANDFIVAGGDGYSMLSNGTVLIDGDAGKLMASTVMDYIAGLGGALPGIEGRITQQ